MTEETPIPVLGVMRELFEAHGVPVVERDGWLLPDSRAPLVRAQVVPTGTYPRGVSARLDVQVFLSKRYMPVESCAGWGTDRDEALRIALESFTRGSFHVLLAALWGVVDPEQVTVETWTVGGARYRVTIGNWVMRAAEAAATVPSEAMPALEAQIRSLPGNEAWYWVRMYHGNPGSAPAVTEVLLNNEPWPEAHAVIDELPWERRDTFYSARLFLVLQRLDGPSPGLPAAPPAARGLIRRLFGRG